MNSALAAEEDGFFPNLAALQSDSFWDIPGSLPGRKALLLGATPDSQDHLIRIGQMNGISPFEFRSKPHVRGG
jgi:hypothetical protein